MGILRDICSHRREVIHRLRKKLPLSELEASRTWNEPRRDCVAALQRKRDEPIRFLSEIKRASPSAGPIRPGADPAEIAKEYVEAGASALSVLTEPDYFDGDPAFLAAAREAVALPLLMKDFIVDDWQIPWARSLGADAVLLIVAALDPVQLRDFLAAARELGLATLVEVHDERELDAALIAGTPLLGINHRDLATFTIDLSLSERLLPRIPSEIVRVAESGIQTREDVLRLESIGLDAVLVGEVLMRAASPGEELRALRGEGMRDR